MENNKFTLQGPLGPSGAVLVFFCVVFDLLIASLAFFLPGDPSLLIYAILTMSPILGMGLYFMLRHMGELIITEDEVILRRFKREQRIRIADITGFKDRDLHIPPNFTLLTQNGQRLKFSRQIPDFIAIYALLCERIPALQYKGPKNFPVSMTSSKSILINLGGGWAVFGVLSCISAWYGLNIAGNDLGDVVAFSVILFLMGAAMCSLIYLGFPRKLYLTATAIDVCPLFLARRAYLVSDIIYISYRQEDIRGNGTGGLRPVVVIEMQNEKKLRLTETACNGLGLTAETFFRMLVELYEPLGIKCTA